MTPPKPAAPLGASPEDLAALTLELVSVPSETDHEAAIADLLEALCIARVGAGATLRVGNSVIAHTPALEGRPRLGFFGHSDTVRADPSQPYEIRGGRVYGCGASDMKGALAVMLALLQEAPAFTQAQGIFVFYDKEEGPMANSGMPAALEALEAAGLGALDLGLCLEPTDGELQVGCVGSSHVRVRIPGRRAHSARPWHGLNAVTEAIPLLSYLAQRGPRRVEIGGFTFADVLSVTTANTSNSRNVVPDVFELSLNHRFPPGVSVAAAHAALLAELAPHTQGAEVEILDTAPSGSVEADHPLLASWVKRHGIRTAAKQAWTDVARLSERGIPAANYGPGATGQAHQAGEWVEIDALVASHRALRDLLT